MRWVHISVHKTETEFWTELPVVTFEKRGFFLSETLKIVKTIFSYFRPNFRKIAVSPKLKLQKWDLFR